IVVGLVMIAMHFKSPTGVEASFAHLWNDGGWFPKGISGFFAGYGVYGPLSTISREQMEQQFSSNFFGAHQLTMRLLPALLPH
ncbi:hypothetical protein MJM04_36505, partial [Salmonella enterica subsp. enterica serovar Cerro]|nr:hypothetical protein [Salmonella enterica subsp. enterica serovar Cerro]